MISLQAENIELKGKCLLRPGNLPQPKWFGLTLPTRIRLGFNFSNRLFPNQQEVNIIFQNWL